MSETILSVQIKMLPHGRGLPKYATPGSAGMDLVAAVEEDVTLPRRVYGLFPTGVALSLPVGFEAQIRPRSGLASKHGITILNAPGTIDSDYRREIMVVLVNLGFEHFTITPGMRIAQMVIAPVQQVQLVQVDSLDDTERGAGGFGSTGVK